MEEQQGKDNRRIIGQPLRQRQTSPNIHTIDVLFIQRLEVDQLTSSCPCPLHITMATAYANAVFPRSHVGFDSITSQIEKKLLKRGFQFNVICVGEFTQCQV